MQGYEIVLYNTYTLQQRLYLSKIDDAKCCDLYFILTLPVSYLGHVGYTHLKLF